jgi:hypothetical protein
MTEIGRFFQAAGGIVFGFFSEEQDRRRRGARAITGTFDAALLLDWNLLLTSGFALHRTVEDKYRNQEPGAISQADLTYRID